MGPPARAFGSMYGIAGSGTTLGEGVAGANPWPASRPAHDGLIAVESHGWRLYLQDPDGNWIEINDAAYSP